jgi:1-acylglycerone phosphate reductase
MTAVDTDVAAVQRMFDINLFGPMRMVRSFHAMIIAAQGTIVNIGSIGGIIPFLYGCKPSLNRLSLSVSAHDSVIASYNASKAALVHWGNTLRVEMKPFG